MTKDFRSDVRINNNLTASAGTTTLGVTNVVGAMTANTASISGSVTFTAGTLGPFIVSSGSLTSSSGVITASTASFTGNVYLPSTASLSGSVIATQAWVSSQGYSTGGSSASTGTGSVVYNTSPTFLGTITASTASFTGNHYLPVTSSAGGYQIFAGNNDATFIALGASALQNWYGGNSGGAYSIAIGHQAMAYNRANAGSDNIAIGYQAFTASTGNPGQNIVIGNYTFGAQNASVGTLIGTGNVIIGNAAAGAANGTVNNNTILGAQTFTSASTTNNNTGIGYNSFSNLTTGIRNTALGSNAGNTTTTGSYNLSLGYNVYPITASLSGTVQIGTDNGGVAATATTSNQIVLGTVNHSTNIPGAASVGGNKITTNDIIRGINQVPAGSIDSMSRFNATTAVSFSSNVIYYNFFTASDTITASSFNIYTTTLVTASIKFALYSVSNGDLASASLTMVAKSASTSITTQPNGITTRAFNAVEGYPATYTMTAGARYAVGIYAGATISPLGINLYSTNGFGTVLPIMIKQVVNGTSLIVTSAASALGDGIVYTWIRLQ